MLAQEGYGLIVGDWDGVDWLAREAFLEALPEKDHPTRLQHVANYQRPDLRRVPLAPVLPDGPNPGYSAAAIMMADAGIIISGRKGSRPAMDALLRQRKPVLPIPFLGQDAFEIFRDILAAWSDRPVQGLTERQFLELMKPWRHSPRTVVRLLKAALTQEPEIFISYRRDDVPAAAGRIHEELAHMYGHRGVFIDYANLDAGGDIEFILEKLERCRVVVALIGPGWDGGRLGQPEDFLRRELELAKRIGATVVPVLIGRTTPPRKNEVPTTLQFLCDLSAAVLHIDHWEPGMRKVVEAVETAIMRKGHHQPV
jgi:hypothetical protein